MRRGLPPIFERGGTTRSTTSNADSGNSSYLHRGVVAHNKRQFLQALEAWKHASEQGDAEASYRIGLLYTKGEGVVRSVPDAAVWYNRAAEAGHVEAQYHLGRI